MRIALSLLVLTLATITPSGAQAPAPRAGGPPPSPTAEDGVAYHVSYAEALPGTREQVTAALRAYRDAARREPGAVRIDLFRQIGRDTHFVVVEAWASLQAREAHDRAPSAGTLRAALATLSASAYDERPYKTLTVAPVENTGPGTVHVISHVDTIPTPGSDGPGLMRRIAAASRSEAGNLRFDVLQHAQRANHFTVVESWASARAADAHATAAHTRQYRAELTPLTGSPLDERLMTLVE